MTGKPISIGGSLFRHEATGAGVVMVIERACERLGWNLAEPALRRPGLRQRRRHRRDRAAREGRDRDRASRTSRAASCATAGSTSRRCTSTSREHGSLEGFAGRRGSRTRSCSSCACDVLVLAAREDQVTAANAREPALPAARRGRERADLGRRRRDPRRARHPGAARRAHERRRRHRLATSSGCRT